MGQSTLNLMIAVGICSSASFVQISRAAVLTVRNNEYVEAARAIGSNSFHTVFSHILPNSLAPIIGPGGRFVSARRSFPLPL